MNISEALKKLGIKEIKVNQDEVWLNKTQVIFTEPSRVDVDYLERFLTSEFKSYDDMPVQIFIEDDQIQYDDKTGQTRIFYFNDKYQDVFKPLSSIAKHFIEYGNNIIGFRFHEMTKAAIMIFMVDDVKRSVDVRSVKNFKRLLKIKSYLNRTEVINISNIIADNDNILWSKNRKVAKYDPKYNGFISDKELIENYFSDIYENLQVDVTDLSDEFRVSIMEYRVGMNEIRNIYIPAKTDLMDTLKPLKEYLVKYQFVELPPTIRLVDDKLISMAFSFDGLSDTSDTEDEGYYGTSAYTDDVVKEVLAILHKGKYISALEYTKMNHS